LKFLFLVLTLVSALAADQITKKTLACPDMVKLTKAPVGEDKDPLDLEMYMVANGCVVLTKMDKIQAIGYDPRNSQEIYQQIVLKKTGEVMYILRSVILVEQGGKKGQLRF